MRICIDIDGTICNTRSGGESYADVTQIKDAAETIRALKQEGHYIILYTARHMKTCNHNTGRVIATQGKILLEWLEKHQIPYDELLFGKPLADIYIDDKAHKFLGDWNQTKQEIDNV